MGNDNRGAADRMFGGRIGDLIASSEYTLRISHFLTPAEQAEAYSIARASGAGERCFFWGGAAQTERRCALFLPEWMIPDGTAPGGAFDEAREEAVREIIDSGADSGEIGSLIVALRTESGAYSELTHRDYLGALTALGIERDSIGDIFVDSPSSSYVFALASAASYIVSELSSVGKERVAATFAKLPHGFRIEREYEPISETVMSPRLDGVVRVLCRISREDAAELVEKGDVSVNYSVVTKTDRTLERGDIISVRGHGKYVYDGDRGVNRRGRLRIDARKYI